jgi:vacuolar-type H+-ATPase subunit H
MSRRLHNAVSIAAGLILASVAAQAQLFKQDIEKAGEETRQSIDHAREVAEALIANADARQGTS